MRVVEATAYGPPEVLHLRDVAKPIPKNNEVLVRIYATTVTRADCELRRFTFPGWIWLPMRLWFGLRKPRVKILGQEFAGQVEAVGARVTSFAPGDRVFGSTGLGLGAHAEYICLAEQPQGGALARMPASLSYAEAAPVPYGGSEALRFLRTAKLQRGQRLLVIGAGGSFGTFGVQLAKLGGAEVTAVDSSGKLAMLRSIGADHVFDFNRVDPLPPGETFDVIFDVVGRVPFPRLVRRLRAGGRMLLANPQTSHLVRGVWASLTGDRKVVFGVAAGSREDLIVLANRIAAGEVKVVIDRSFPLEDIVEAHRYAETDEKKGSIVVEVVRESA